MSIEFKDDYTQELEGYSLPPEENNFTLTPNLTTENNFTSSTPNLDDFSQLYLQSTSIESLQKLLINERNCPELLKFNFLLLEEVNELLELQLANLEIIQLNSKNKPEDEIKVLLLQSDIDKIQYCLRNYFRTRIDKIERYSIYFYLNLNIFQELFAEFELDYLRDYYSLYTNYLKSNQPETLPEEIRLLDINENQILKPNLNEPVFIKCLTKISDYTLENSEVIEMNPGNIFFLSYSSIRDLLEKELVELI
ncbi:hypothetical protein K502DRAFT_322884 [Neoconidiobolus thromboides FSU 785]|nr:hypothetical protein K502DRAFT_322884 [Neoconidiobolus thromboides FSU 785]